MYIYVTVTFEMGWLKLDKITYMFHLFKERKLVWFTKHITFTGVWYGNHSIHIGLQCTSISKLTTINTC